MAATIYIVHYGTRDTKVTPVNTTEYAAKIAAGLQRLATALTDPETVFGNTKDFSRDAPDNTWVHISMVTEPVVPLDRDEETDLTDYIPRAQFNVHFFVKYLVDEDELADGIDTLSGSETLLGDK